MRAISYVFVVTTAGGWRSEWLTGIQHGDLVSELTFSVSPHNCEIVVRSTATRILSVRSHAQGWKGPTLKTDSVGITKFPSLSNVYQCSYQFTSKSLMTVLRRLRPYILAMSISRVA